MEPINGKEYPLWSQFVDRKEEWIGGTLIDEGGSMDRHIAPSLYPAVTEITDITLEANGPDSAFFAVVGKHFTCGFDVRHGGIIGSGDHTEWLCFSGYGGHHWRIKQKGATKDGQLCTDG